MKKMKRLTDKDQKKWYDFEFYDMDNSVLDFIDLYSRTLAQATFLIIIWRAYDSAVDIGNDFLSKLSCFVLNLAIYEGIWIFIFHFINSILHKLDLLLGNEGRISSQDETSNSSEYKFQIIPLRILYELNGLGYFVFLVWSAYLTWKGSMLNPDMSSIFVSIPMYCISLTLVNIIPYCIFLIIEKILEVLDKGLGNKE